MATVYSIRFFQELGLNGTRSYTCPLGYRLVLRDADLYCDNSGAAGSFWLRGAAAQTIWHVSLAGFSTTDGQWRGRQVILEGETFTITADTDSDVTVSGYLLTLP